MVAEKNMVCRLGGNKPQIFFISSIKPISSIRSASSITKISTPVRRTLPREKWSIRRPGVAMRTSAPRSSFLNCSSNETPPMRRAIVSLWFLPNCSNPSETWAASSRVGAKINDLGMRALARPRSSFVSIGIVNEAVLPVPVWAMPRTSLPSMAGGMAAF